MGLKNSSVIIEEWPVVIPSLFCMCPRKVNLSLLRLRFPCWLASQGGLWCKAWVQFPALQSERGMRKRGGKQRGEGREGEGKIIGSGNSRKLGLSFLKQLYPACQNLSHPFLIFEVHTCVAHMDVNRSIILV